MLNDPKNYPLQAGYIVKVQKTGMPVEYLMSHCRGVLTSTNRADAKVFESDAKARVVIKRYSRSRGVSTCVWVDDPRMPLYGATVEKLG